MSIRILRSLPFCSSKRQCWIAVGLVFCSALYAQVVNDGATSTLINVTNSITGDVTVGTNGSFTLLVLSDNTLLTNSANGVIGRNATAKSNEVQLASGSARWQMGNFLYVGSNGSMNRLVLSNGGFVENLIGVLGQTAASSNNVAVITGTGSRWTNRNALRIGNLSANNQMIVSNGGWVAALNGLVGANSGSSSNLVVVTGSGSVWSNSAGLIVGNFGSGNRVRIEEGGLVYCSDGTVGSNVGDANNNEVMVTGPGSLWTNRSLLQIGGQRPFNRLVVSNGAAARSTVGVVGNSNRVLVTSAGSVWSSQTLLVGGVSGRADANDGGWLESNDGYIGQSFGANSNLVLLTGAGSGWNNLSNFFVGEQGIGNLLIASNGATVLSGKAFIGAGTSGGNDNLAVLTGAGTLWSNQNDFIVGNLRPGNRLEVNAGATVSPGNLFVGFNSAATNSRVTVNGGTIRAANASGTAVLDVRRGTNIIHAGLIDVDRLVLTNGSGFFEFRGGTLVSRGALITNGSGMILGGGTNPAVWDVRPGSFDHFLRNGVLVGLNSSFNQLHVTGGAFLSNAISGFLGTGASANSNAAFVSGAGSRWQVSGDFGVGSGGSFNQLTVADGGWVGATSGRLGGGQSTSSSNLALVSGPGAIWTNATSLTVGDLGPGNQLSISDGATVFAGTDAFIGQSATANGNTVALSDAGTELRVGNELHIGSQGSFNRLIVSDGARVSDQFGAIGRNANGSNNVVVVTGAGSLWTNGFGFVVGFLGRASQLIVSNAGMVVAPGLVDVGNASDDNQAVVTDSGSLLVGELSVGYQGSANRLSVRNGGLVVNDRGFVGLSTDSNAVFIAGSGSLWSNRFDQFVGHDGRRNELIVSDGGTTSTDGDGVIGKNPTAMSNRVTVAGPGSRWLVTSNLIVGNQGAFNRLVLSNGGFISSVQGVVGSEDIASNNVALVTGSGTVWSNTQFLVGIVGDDNQLIVTNGAAVFSRFGTLGFNFASRNNMASVAGTGSVWSCSDSLTVGYLGQSSRMLVSNGGTVETDFGYIGVGGAGNEVTVTGPGSVWTNGFDLFLGQFSEGNRLLINNGGAVVAQKITVGELREATNNRVIVTGGTLRATNEIGTGVLDVRRGTNVFNSGLVDVDNLLLTNKGTMPVFGLFAKAGTNIISESSLIRLTNGVSGLVGRIETISVTLSNLTHQRPDSFNILLVGPAGQKVMLMSDAGGFTPMNNARLIFDDGASGLLPDAGGIVSGTYRPTDYPPDTTLPSPAPAGPYSTNFSSLIGTDPNGVWTLFIENEDFLGSARLVGWNIRIQTDEPFLDSGVFEFNGGTLVTQGAAIDNRVPFVIGGPGGVPAVWEVRAGASSHFVASDLVLGSLIGGSTNNLLHVIGGTLLSSGTLDIRGGTNRLDAGLVDVDRLTITNARGQFELNGGSLRSLNTIVGNGRIFTVGNGASSATLQLVGGTHTFSNNLVVANNASLIGNGVIEGAVTVSPGGRLTPGAAIGRISVLGSVILQGTVNLQLDKSGGVRTNDHVAASGALFYAGTLNVTDIGADVLVAGDRFPLFSATPYVGAFTTITLPPLAPGLAWLNRLSVDGSIEVVSTSQPGFASIRLSGNSLILSGTNGTPGGTYAVLTATNVALPSSNWVSIVTNQFTAGGGFSFTNAVAPGERQRFFRIRTP